MSINDIFHAKCKKYYFGTRIFSQQWVADFFLDFFRLLFFKTRQPEKSNWIGHATVRCGYFFWFLRNPFYFRNPHSIFVALIKVIKDRIFMSVILFWSVKASLSTNALPSVVFSGKDFIYGNSCFDHINCVSLDEVYSPSFIAVFYKSTMY